jgi:hypothetical protein
MIVTTNEAKLIVLVENFMLTVDSAVVGVMIALVLDHVLVVGLEVLRSAAVLMAVILI